MNPSRPDVVFDCNVFLQALTREDGPAAEALRLVERNAVTLHVSRGILRELRQTLAYPEVRRRNPHVTDESVEAFLTRVEFRGSLHRNVPHTFSYSRDPKDVPYLDLALFASAD